VHVAGGWRGTAAGPGLHQAELPLQRGIPPFFHRLEEWYRDAADFVGVIDADADSARAYAAANKVPYRVLADPDRAIIARFEAKNGGYVALLGGNGQLDTLWPGCSAEMMRALGRGSEANRARAAASLADMGQAAFSAVKVRLLRTRSPRLRAPWRNSSSGSACDCCPPASSTSSWRWSWRGSGPARPPLTRQLPARLGGRAVTETRRRIGAFRHPSCQGEM
jgi:hypothetical protein